MALLAAAQQGDVPALLAAAAQEEAAGRALGEVVHARSGDCAMHVAARTGRVAAVEAVLRRGVPADVRNLEGKTALHEAAQACQAATATVLLAAGAEVDAIKRADWTPLMLACTKPGNTAVVELLLAAGARTELRNKDGWTAWHLAARAGDLAILAAILAVAPGAWDTSAATGRSPLHTAALAGHLPTLALLLSLPYSLDLQDSCGNTALMEAARGGHPELLARLGEAGADPSLLDSMGRGVAMVAAQAGALACLEVCRGWGVSGGRSKEGHTMLHTAARAGQEEVVRRLVEWGEELEARWEPEPAPPPPAPPLPPPAPPGTCGAGPPSGWRCLGSTRAVWGCWWRRGPRWGWRTPRGWRCWASPGPRGSGRGSTRLRNLFKDTLGTKGELCNPNPSFCTFTSCHFYPLQIMLQNLTCALHSLLAEGDRQVHIQRWTSIFFIKTKNVSPFTTGSEPGCGHRPHPGVQGHLLLHPAPLLPLLRHHGPAGAQGAGGTPHTLV